MIFPRNSVLPMNEAMEAKHPARRPGVPEASRFPKNASASSIITATGQSALRRLKIFSRLASVTPWPLRAEVEELHAGHADLPGEAGPP